MFLIRHSRNHVVRSSRPAPSAARLLRRAYASRIDIPFTPAPFPTVDSCPSPTCQCRETPSGLDIEREQNLNGSMAAYAEQVLISTGRSDWKSKIEQDTDSFLIKELKSLIGPKGKYSDPYHNVMITNSSFPPTTSPPQQDGSLSRSRSVDRSIPSTRPGKDPSTTGDAVAETASASAFLLPSFQYIPTIPTDGSAVEAFVKAFILPAKLHASHDVLSRAQKNALLREPERQRQFIGARKIDEILVLICGHGERDQRCGVMGPLLKSEFEDKLQRQNVALLHDAPVAEAEIINTEVEGYVPTARVGLISHIGGHKWAGNVIVYIPPSFSSNALAGKGIWYGRVQPEHVEGIVAKTILEGKVIKDMFRGGIDWNGNVLRI